MRTWQIFNVKWMGISQKLRGYLKLQMVNYVLNSVCAEKWRNWVVNWLKRKWQQLCSSTFFERSFFCRTKSGNETSQCMDDHGCKLKWQYAFALKVRFSFSFYLFMVGLASEKYCALLFTRLWCTNLTFVELASPQLWTRTKWKWF